MKTSPENSIEKNDIDDKVEFMCAVMPLCLYYIKIRIHRLHKIYQV